MSRFIARVIACSLAGIIAVALPTLAAARPGGGGQGGGGGGGVSRGGGGGHTAAPAVRAGGRSFAHPGFRGSRSLGTRSFGTRSFSSRGFRSSHITRGSLRHGVGRSGLRSVQSGRGLAGNRLLGRTGSYGAGALGRSGRIASTRAFGHRDWHSNWRGHRGIYSGWVGPLFWPYAYSDLFYHAFWGYGPYDYYGNPFWAYGYEDIYSGMFSPYGYNDLAGWAQPPSTRVARGSRGRGAAAARVGEPDGTTGSLPSNRWTQMCGADAGDVVGLPIERIQAVVKPDDAQRAALDELGNASVKAAETIKAACPKDLSLTPTGRLAAMEQRLQVIRLAVDVVRPAVDSFYNMLTDEQKARLTAVGQRDLAGREQRTIAQDCGAVSSATVWPGEQIDRMVRPTEAQRDGLNKLRDASAKAADLLKSSCPAQTIATPPARLTAMAARLDVMIEAVRTVRTAGEEFYGSLNDEQKAQFNTIGQARAAR